MSALNPPPLSPLKGHLVIDLSQNLPGPLLTRMLCDLGADVIKIEPKAGDPTRHVPPYIQMNDNEGGRHEISALFASLNFGKRSVVLNLKTPEGVEQLKRLVGTADVLVESFRPGVMTRLGVGYETLQQINPKLIYCAITGYGQKGVDAHTPGHDINFIARAGVLHGSGPTGEAPTIPSTQIADIAGGAYPAATAILAALLQRTLDAGPGGRMLDISISRQCLQLLAITLPRELTGYTEAPGEGMLTGGLPCYQVYSTKDGKFMALGALEPKFFTRFCVLAGLEDLAQTQGAGVQMGPEGARTIQRIQERMNEKTRDEWQELFAHEDACCAPVFTPLEAFADESVLHESQKVRLGGLDSALAALPFDAGSTPHNAPSFVAALGQHTASVLSARLPPTELS